MLNNLDGFVNLIIFYIFIIKRPDTSYNTETEQSDHSFDKFSLENTEKFDSNTTDTKNELI